MTDEQARIRSYLVSQGAKLTPAAIVEKVQAAMAELRQAALAIPAARFGERPAPGEWSANEVMAHVVASGAHFGDAILSVLDGRPLPGRAEREAAVAVRTAEEWWRILDAARTDLFDRALGADPAAHLDRAIDHGMFGSLNWRETLLFLRLHDLDHAGQLRTIAAALASA